MGAKVDDRIKGRVRTTAIALGAVMVIVLFLWIASISERKLEFEYVEEDRMNGYVDLLRDKIHEAERVARKEQENPRQLLEVGRLYHANAILDAAERVYLEILRKRNSGEEARVYYYLADIFKSKGDLPQTELFLNKSLLHDADYMLTYLNLGDVRYKLGNLEEAKTAYEKALLLDPRLPYALIGLARERLQSDDDEGALKILEELVFFNPKFSNGRALLAQVLERNGKPERASLVRAANESGWDIPPEDPWMEEVFKYCYDIQKLRIQVEDYRRIGEVGKALSLLDRMQDIAPDDANVYEMRGLTLAEVKNHAEAISSYLKALELGENSGMLYLQLAKAYFELGQLKEAEEIARKGVRIFGDNSELFVTLALICTKKGDNREALKFYEKAIEFDPYDRYANTILAKYHWTSGRQNRAIKYLKTIQQIAPNDMFSRVALGSYYLNTNRPKLAVPSLEQAYKIDSDDENAAHLLAIALCKIGLELERGGSDSQALKQYDRALRISPESVAAKEGKSRVSKKQGSG